MAASDLVLEVRELRVAFPSCRGLVRAVDGLSFKVRRGRTLAIVGESGCGKSSAARALIGLLPKGTEVSGRILYRPRRGPSLDLAKLDPDGEELRRLRGAEIAMIYQDPANSLNPFYTVGWQIAEAVRLHQPVSPREARRRAVEMLGRVGIPSPERRAGEYPHQLSGGMRQRVVIAMALVNRPALLIADEPTTALDVTVQAQILELMRELQAEYGTAIVLITHDLGVVAQTADDVVVMYLGRAVERGPVLSIFEKRCHPYTEGLFGSLPRPGAPVRERLRPVEGVVPDAAEAGRGCRFASRCPRRTELCRFDPPEVQVGPSHAVRCWLFAPHPGGVQGEAKYEAKVFSKGLGKAKPSGNREGLGESGGEGRADPLRAAHQRPRPAGSAREGAP